MAPDTGTLAWVKDEIDLALERASEALARHAAAPEDPKPLAEAQGFLHQASGALAIVGLTGVTHFVTRIEARLAALAETKAANDVVALAAASGAAMAALRRYLDELMAGHPDQPLRLYPAYRALELAAGAPAPAPRELFFPDLTQRPPRREEAPAPYPPARLKALRLGFARGLAKWRAGEPRGLVEMRNAVAGIEQGFAEPAERALWWVATAWFETRAAAGAPPPDEALLSALDRQCELLADGRRDLDGAPAELMTGLLYDIAVAPPGSEQLESVRAAYRLADLIPAAALAADTRRAACRAPLMTAMQEWERFDAGSAIALMRFHDVAQLLAATAQESQDAELARLAKTIADFAGWLRQRPERADRAMALEVASALVLIEDAIEEEGARSPQDALLFAAEVAGQIARLDLIRETGVASQAALPRQRWREHRLVRQVATEIRADLDAIEPILDAFFQAPDAAGRADPLPDAAARLRRIAGVLALLDEAAAARLAAALASRIGALQAGAAADFAALAEGLAALGQFADSLARHQPDHAVLARCALSSAEAAAPASGEPEDHSPAPTALAQDDALLAIFIEEAHEVLAALAAEAPRLAAHPGDREALTAIRRAFHTLKGSGRMVGLTALGEAAFAVEKRLNRRLDERAPADAELLALIEAARMLFERWVVALERHESPPDPADLIHRCGAAPAPAAEAVPPAPTLRGESAPGGTFAFPPAPTAAPALALVPPPQEEVVVIGERALSPTLFKLYVEEAQGHVAALRRELAEPAGVPSRELIRAAHTLAGISAGTGFAAVEALARALENALVRHSLAHVAPTEAGRMLIARAVGALEGMVGAIAERRAPAEETTLADALAALEAPQAATAKTEALSPLAERRASRPADEIDPQLAALFLEEADEALRALDADLAAWRAQPAEAKIGQRLARLLHTFKGGARMCGAMGLGELAHGMETRVEAALAAGGASGETLDHLDASLGRAHHLVDALREQVAGGAPPAAAASASPPATTPAPESGPAVLLRVRADLIDRLVDEAGEMAIARSRLEGSVKSVKGALIDLAENVARLRGQLREFEILAESRMPSQLTGHEAQGRDFDPLEFDRFTRLQELTRMMAESVADVATVQHALVRQTEIAAEALASQSRHNRELSNALLAARMVPFATVAERLHRVVRQTAKELGRQANLDIEGGKTPLDRNVLERMVGPLEHLLRNAVAHGIEPPKVRLAAGKPELGQITLTITPTDHDITLTLADDGAGLDYAAIRARAVSRGLIAAEATPDEATLAELVFLPGFSTAGEVSAIAGRGVGLDVVKNEVGQMGGRVELASTPGQGTRFTLVLPLTLAMIPVMLATAAGRPWAIPAAMVEEARELAPEEAASRRAAGGLTKNGRHYPWHSLPGLYGLPADAGSPGWQLLLKSGGEQIALEAEALAPSQEVVVKPLGVQLRRVPGLSGATVLPDGTVALIVNPVALARRARRLPPAVPPAPTLAASSETRPSVLVVDDSLTVRKITGRLLERAGYRVLTAKDGLEALECLERERPAALIADIEMPRLDGFELVRRLRADPMLADLPVIMITSRIADKHRQVAAELGVEHYLGKPYDEDALLALIAGLVKPA